MSDTVLLLGFIIIVPFGVLLIELYLDWRERHR
jgi:hypothetical protein